MMNVIDFPRAGNRDVKAEPAAWPAESAAWLRVTVDVTIAYAGHMFGGMVARQWGRFTAYDLFGAPCGVYSSVDEAERRVEAVLAHPSVASWLRDAARPVDRRDTSTARARGLTHIGAGTASGE